MLRCDSDETSSARAVDAISSPLQERARTNYPARGGADHDSSGCRVHTTGRDIAGSDTQPPATVSEGRPQ
jgi:hypothetical protein